MNQSQTSYLKRKQVFFSVLFLYINPFMLRVCISSGICSKVQSLKTAAHSCKLCNGSRSLCELSVFTLSPILLHSEQSKTSMNRSTTVYPFSSCWAYTKTIFILQSWSLEDSFLIFMWFCATDGLGTKLFTRLTVNWKIPNSEMSSPVSIEITHSKLSDSVHLKLKI